MLGSNLNPILTQLAKTRRALFLEGKDFQILGRFARKLGFDAVANRRDFAVVPVEGFNPERIRNLKLGMEETLGRPIAAAAVMDKDYRSDGEREAIISACEAYCRYTVIHKCKEIENFLLVPAAIDRAAERRVADHARRTGATRIYSGNAAALLSAFAEQERPSIMGRYIGDRRRFERTISSHLADATIGEAAVREFERCWGTEQSRLEVIPGKDALRALNQDLQEQYGVNVTAAGIVDAMRRDEVPAEMVELIQNIANFSALRVD